MPTANSGGVDIAYTDSGGSGLPVLLLHAWPLKSEMWSAQVDALSGRFRFLAVDFRGFGSSGAPDDPGAYSMDTFAADAAAVLDAAGVERTVVCGLSMGGYVTFALLRRDPERVAGVVLADTRAEADPPERIEQRAAQQQQVAAEGTHHLVETLVGGPLLSDTTRNRKPDVVERVRSLADSPPAGYIGGLEALKTRPDSTPQLAAISVPALILVGEEDALTPPATARSMHEHIGGSEMVVVPDAGHLSNLESPEVFTGALARFLQGL
jgi:pimeloyl-ACP methyl ester carboxylesterase